MQIVSETMARSAAAARAPRFWERWRQRFARARTDARLRAELRYELRCLDEAGELDGALANLGLSRAAIPELLRRYPGSVRRHAMMARRVGARPPSPRAGLVALMGSRRRCLFCGESRRCERWLEAGEREGYRDFCPNAGAFEHMKKGR
jgi:hypothetical protein